MNGILESMLTRLYGKPKVIQSTPFIECRWNETDEPRRCVLYKPVVWDAELERRLGVLKPVYGDAVGGSILRGALRISMLRGPKVWGLYQIDELQTQLRDIPLIDHRPSIQFFMDSANVWYYGVRDALLYVYDTEEPEVLDALGLIEPELERLILQWESSK